MAYPFADIEKKWQDEWEKRQTFNAENDFTKPKYYVLDMFPYPSGAGLHVGHPEGYTATDIVARYKRMQGYNVLHPMGWDAFGLPAERYAMQTGIHPAITTKKNIDNFRRQLKSLGFSYDWSREINTTDADYYKFTQWIFLKLFNSYYDTKVNKALPIEELQIPQNLNGKEREEFIASHRLAYIASMPVNWCAELGTVLANEEVEEWVGKGYKVERRPMRQWMLRITAYAERLLDDLVHVDWPQSTLELQKNWIGRSTGALVTFAVDTQHAVSLQVFTTRPDTLYGVTFMVLAPEHPLVDIITPESHKKQVAEYREKTALKTDLERQRGVQHPKGAGALPVGEIDVNKKDKSGVMVGAYAIHPLTNEKIPIYIADYVLMGYGTGAIMAVPAHDERDFAFAEAFGIEIKPVVETHGSTGSPTGAPLPRIEDGVAVNSPIIDGLKTQDAKAKMIEYLEKNKIGERRVQYKLRDWLFSRQRYWGEPVPISFTEDGFMVAEEEADLPLVLPESQNLQPSGGHGTSGSAHDTKTLFVPTGTGESPLAHLTNWVNFSKDGKKLSRETNTMPQWAGSSWYYLRFADPHNKERFASKESEAYWLKDGVDLYVGGAEHAVLHLLYARFWHKVLYDLGYVTSIEPFKKLVHQGIILGEDGSKMSKSRGNVINPDMVVAEYGADTFRLYEMFMGPLEQMKPWSSKSIEGIYRFLARIYRLYFNDGKINSKLLEKPKNEKAVLKILNQTIKKVSQDIESLSLNTAISQMMIFVNETYKLESIGKDAAEKFVQLLHPFAPHLSEEIWQALGYSTSIAKSAWPTFDPSLLVEDEFEAVIQINGKIRARQSLKVGISDADFENFARKIDSIQVALERKTIRKVIVVKNKMINFVV
ncbi:MAG: Leucine--tRNA ligase [Turneriella sp.]|nr:Leucine--tRNA ligase [Turneriella sp.]